MNYAEIKNCDIANGPGVRVSLFVSGCTHHCPGCFNQVAWDFDYGEPFTKEVRYAIMDSLRPDYIKGLSLLGGDPMEEANQPEILRIVRAVRERFGTTKSIWLWTGRRYEKVAQSPIFDYVDTVVDGPFIEHLKVKEKGCWFGSSNQRVIPLKDVRQHV